MEELRRMWARNIANGRKSLGLSQAQIAEQVSAVAGRPGLVWLTGLGRPGRVEALEETLVWREVGHRRIPLDELAAWVEWGRRRAGRHGRARGRGVRRVGGRG